MQNLKLSIQSFFRLFVNCNTASVADVFHLGKENETNYVIKMNFCIITNYFRSDFLETDEIYVFTYQLTRYVCM